MELDDLIEVAAHIETLRLLVLPMVARAEQREVARLKKAKYRLTAPTTTADAPQRALRSV